MAAFWETAADSVDHMFSFYFDYLLFQLFPAWDLGSNCTSSWSLHIVTVISYFVPSSYKPGDFISQYSDI